MLTKEELLKKYSYYFERDFPVLFIPFKHKKTKDVIIEIHPILMSKLNEFFYCIQALRLDETEMAANRMNYIDYILYLHEKDKKGEFAEDDDKKDILYKFINILSMCLNTKIDIINKSDKNILVLNRKIGFRKTNNVTDSFMVVNENPMYGQILLSEVQEIMKLDNYNGDKEIECRDYVQFFDTYIELTNRDLDDIRKIINYQNVYNYDDSYMCEELRKDIEETAKLKAKNGGNIDSEKQRMNLSLVLGKDYNELENFTIRRYYAYLSLINNKEAFLLMKEAEMSGMVEIKNPPKHYLEEDDDTPSNLVDAKGIRDKLK